MNLLPANNLIRYNPIRLVLLKLKLFYLQYSNFYVNKKKTQAVSGYSLSSQLTVGAISRKYTKRFYRKVLKKRYDRKIKLDALDYSRWRFITIWDRPFNPEISFKSFFHIKIFFNINEFLMYDFYNFHKGAITNGLKSKNISPKFIPKKPWRKLNFFFYIKYSIDVFRTHTLQFFKTKFSSDRKVTVLLNGFRGLTSLSYIWFFEYSLPYFLVKTRFAESIGQGLTLVLGDVIFINNSTGFSKWSFVSPKDIMQLLFNIYFIVRLKWMIYKFFDFFRRTKRFFKRTILRAKRYRTKMPKTTAKGIHLNNSKHLHLRFLETDYKSLSVVLLPYSNPQICYSALTLFWLNFLNYILNVWKYEI